MPQTYPLINDRIIRLSFSEILRLTLGARFPSVTDATHDTLKRLLNTYESVIEHVPAFDLTEAERDALRDALPVLGAFLAKRDDTTLDAVQHFYRKLMPEDALGTQDWLTPRTPRLVTVTFSEREHDALSRELRIVVNDPHLLDDYRISHTAFAAVEYIRVRLLIERAGLPFTMPAESADILASLTAAIAFRRAIEDPTRDLAPLRAVTRALRNAPEVSA